MPKDLRFDVTALDQASKTFTRMGQAIERFEKRLDRLDGKRVNAEIGVETGKAEAEIGAFATSARRKLQAALSSLPEIEIDANSTPAQRELAQVRRRMAELGDKRIGVDISAEDALAETAALQRELDRLGRTSPDIQVRADAAAAATQLAAIGAEVDRLDGRRARVRVEVDKSISDTVIQVAALGRALGTLAIPAALVTAAPQLASLGAAAVQATGALGLIPAAGLAAAGAIGTLVIGFQNFGDAVGDDPEKAAEALAKLAPAARETALAVRAMGPAWSALQLDVQGELFRGLGEQISQVGSTYLPILRTGLSDMAESLNESATGFATFLQQASTTSTVRTLVDDVSDSIEGLAKALTPLGSAFLAVGAEVLADLSEGAGDAAQSLADMTARARASGDLEQWIRGGVDALRQLGSIAGNVGSALGGIFRASRESGADFLATVDQVTEALARMVNSASGQNALISLFRDIQAGVQAAIPGLERLTAAVAGVVQALADSGVLRAAGEAFTAIADQVAPLISMLGGLAPLVSGLLSVVGALAPVLTSAAIALGAFWAAAKIVDGVQNITGRVQAFGSALGGIRTAAGEGGATGVLRTLGRSLGAGGVLGIGLAAAGIALQIWADRNAAAAQAAQENKAKVDELAASFDNVTGSATAATREIKAQELTQVKLADGTTSLATALDQLGISSQTWVDATTGSIPAQQELAEKLNQVTQKAIEQSPAWQKNAREIQSWGVSLQDVVAAANGNVDAQNRLRDAARYSAAGITENERANSELVDTLIRTGGASGEVASRLGEAIGRYAEAKTQADQVREATASFTDGLRTLGNEGLRVFAALASGAPVTAEMAAGLQQVGSSATTMALDVGRSTAAVSGVEQGAIAARDKMAGLRQQFIDTAAAAGMPVPQAERLADSLGLIPSVVETQIRMNLSDSQAQLLQVQTMLKGLPPNTAVNVSVLSQEAIGELDRLGFKVETLPDGTFRVVPETAQANAALDDVVAKAQQPATKPLLGDPSDVLSTDATARGAIQTPATKPMLADPSDVRGKDAEARGLIQQPATKPLEGNPAGVLGVNGTATSAIQQPATKPLLGNPADALGKNQGVVSAVQAPATKPINATDGGARGVVNSFVGWVSTLSVAIRVVANKIGFEGGGIMPMESGGVIPMAGGGGNGIPREWNGHRLTPMNTTARIVGPRTYRVVGDRAQGDEAYIPLVPSSGWSQTLLDVAANRMGRELLPKGMKLAPTAGAAVVPMAEGGMLSAARAILGRMSTGGQMSEDWTWKGAPAVVGQYNDALLDAMKRSGYRYAGGRRFLEDYVRRASATSARPVASAVKQPSGVTTAAMRAQVQAVQAAQSAQASAVAGGIVELRALLAETRAQTSEARTHSGLLRGLRGDVFVAGQGGSPDVVEAVTALTQGLLRDLPATVRAAAQRDLAQIGRW